MQAQTLELTPTPDKEQVMVVRPQPQSLSLFRTDDPVEVVQRASAVASALRDVISKQGLISNIQGKQYPKCEAWTLCGTMLGIFPVLCWSRPVGKQDAQEKGWEARVEARTRDGAIVGAAEAQCLNTERNWAKRDDFALRSMAQTRATAKALRMPLGFIMTLAGYEATPSEEMTFDKRPQRQSNIPPEYEDDGEGTDLGPQKNLGASGEGKAARPASSDSSRTADREQAARTVPNSNPVPTQRHKDRMIAVLIEHFGDQAKIKEFAEKAEILLPSETLLDWPMRYVAADPRQMEQMRCALRDFFDGEPAVKPFTNSEPLAAATQARAASPDAPTVGKGPAQAAASKPEWFMEIVVPIPRKGMKKDEYLKHPDTIGSLFKDRKEDETARKRLWGFTANWKPEPYQGRPPRDSEIKFREALDAFQEWFAQHHPDERL